MDAYKTSHVQPVSFARILARYYAQGKVQLSNQSMQHKRLQRASNYVQIQFQIPSKVLVQEAALKLKKQGNRNSELILNNLP